MSYGISLHPREIKLAHQAGAELDEFKHAPIPEAVREAFIERLLRRQYELESTNATCKTFVHRKKEWGLTVNVFKTEISFSVPYWGDAENAIFEAIMTAHELCDSGDLFVYDQQTGEWSE